jgi:hypothetical protein
MSYSDDEFKIGDTEEADLDLDLDVDLDEPIEEDLLGIEEGIEEPEEDFAGLDGSMY